MKKYIVIALAIASALLFQAGPMRAQQTNQTDVPRSISYQGVLNQSGTPVNGEEEITVSIYADAAGANKIWYQTFDATVTNGIFDLNLGSAENPLPPSNQLDRSLWLGVQVKGDQFQSISPLTASPYALNVSDSAITTTKLAYNSVTNDKLAPSSITSDKLNMDYMASISVNGIPVSSTGANNLNIVGGDGISALWDETTNSLLLSSASGGIGGMHTLTVTTIPDGGTGLSTIPTDGQLLIGSTTGTDYVLSTLTAGSGISITNGSGAITITNTSPSSGGTVTSVGVSGGSTGLTTSGGPITSSGTITLGGTLGIGFGGTGSTTASTAFVALSPLTTEGDILFENSSPAPDRLPIGTTGQVLTVSGGVPEWETLGSGSFILNQYTEQTSAGFNIDAGAPVISSSFSEATITADATSSTYGVANIGLKIFNSGTLTGTLSGNVGITIYVSGTGTVPNMDIEGSLDSWNILSTGDATFNSATLVNPLTVPNGGTGRATTPTNGQLLIGSTSGSDYSLSTLTPGTGISIANGAGSITIALSGVVPWENGGTGESNTTGSGTFVVGDNSNLASNVYFGGGQTAPSSDNGYGWTLHGQDGNGTDKAGGAIGFYGGRSTGSAEGGPINFAVGIASVSGTGIATGTAPMTFSPSGTSLATATGTLQIGATGQATGNIVLANEADPTSDVGTIKAAALSAPETWTMPAATGTVTVTGAGGGLLTAGTGISITNASAVTTISQIAGTTYQAQPSNPTGNSTGALEFAGLFSPSHSFTPVKSGTVLIIISGNINNSTLNKGSLIEMIYGNGAPPTNAEAITGIGTQIAQEITAISSTSSGAGVSTIFPFSIQAVVTGLMLSTAYWVDLAIANDGGGTATLTNLSVSVTEF